MDSPVGGQVCHAPVPTVFSLVADLAGDGALPLRGKLLERGGLFTTQREPDLTFLAATVRVVSNRSTREDETYRTDSCGSRRRCPGLARGSAPRVGAWDDDTGRQRYHDLHRLRSPGCARPRPPVRGCRTLGRNVDPRGELGDDVRGRQADYPRWTWDRSGQVFGLVAGSGTRHLALLVEPGVEVVS